MESFETILIAFGCSRVIFAGQYLTSKSTLQTVLINSGMAGTSGQT